MITLGPEALIYFMNDWERIFKFKQELRGKKLFLGAGEPGSAIAFRRRSRRS